jgi:hypothetical protein
MTSFQYPALERPDRQFRLLRRTSTTSDRLEFELTVHDIPLLIGHSKRNVYPAVYGRLPRLLSYCAISYAWGNSDLLEIIRVNEHDFNVRSNCHYALTQSLRHTSESYLWIDSVCIDQEDDLEKSAQVKIMSSISRNAGEVMASVGPHADNSQLVVGHVMGDHITPELSVAVEAFATRPFWSRLWIVQELYLARVVRLMCGDDVIHSWLETHWGLFLNRGHGRHERGSFHDVFDILMTTKARLGIFCNIDRAVRHSSQFQCQYPRDHVFALLSLCGDGKTGLEIDYSLAAETLAGKFADGMGLKECPQDIRSLLGVLLVGEASASS